MKVFLKRRNQLLAENYLKKKESHLHFSEKEEKVNGYLKNLTNEFLTSRQTNIQNLSAFQANFFLRKEFIENSRLYKVLRKMPKGALLHTHFLAMLDVETLVKYSTYSPNCYFYTGEDSLNGNLKKGQVNFFKIGKQPKDFIPINDIRQKTPKFDEILIQTWRMVKEDINGSDTSRWQKFANCFTLPWGCYWFIDNFKRNFIEICKSLLEDNVQYIETNTSLGEVYDLDNGKLSYEATVSLFQELNNQFLSEFGKDEFLGVKLIHEALRTNDKQLIENEMRQTMELQKKFPNFIVAYDLVGQEDGPESHDSLYFAETCLNILEEAKKQKVEFSFRFHGGETLSLPLENLYDVILLGSKRIGHGFNLFRFPRLMEEILSRDICIEVCPISNNLIGYCPDLRNHPAIGYYAQGIPLVLSNDDPGIMGYQGATHDFFVAVVDWGLDLKGLKELALNSIRYIGGTVEDRKKLQMMWNKKYDEFLEFVSVEMQQNSTYTTAITSQQ